MAQRLPPAPVVRYGEHPDQVANLHLPAGVDESSGTVLLLHGGFWRERWDRTLMTPLAVDLAGRGYAVWNVEYRRVGQEGGGYPGTLDDVAAALEALADVPQVDPDRIVAVGHSAGGHLALWLLGARTRAVRLAGAASLGGVCDLEQAHRERLGDGAVAAFLGPASAGELAARVDDAAPLRQLGTAPRLLVHGARDDIVPVAQSRVYAEQARSAGVEVELVEIPDADHFDVVDPGQAAWGVVLEALPALLRDGAPTA